MTIVARNPMVVGFTERGATLRVTTDHYAQVNDTAPVTPVLARLHSAAVSF